MSNNTELQAKNELAVLNKDAESVDETEIFVWLDNAGLPMEINTRIMGLWKKVHYVGNVAINIGKIILLQVIDFVNRHPHTAIGILVGVALGAIVNLIPFVGPLLSPIVNLIAISLGLISGAALDHPECGSPYEAVHLVAKDFFSRFTMILNSVKELRNV